MAKQDTQPALPPGASYTPPPLPPGASYQAPSGAPSGGTAPTQGQQPPPQQPQMPLSLRGVAPPPPNQAAAASVLHGAIGPVVEAGRMANEWGAKPMGWDLSKALPPSMVRGWEKLGEQAKGSPGGEILGGSLPFVAAGPFEALPLAGRVLMRSILPALLQPTQGPISVGEKALQTVLGTVMGEGMQGLSKLAGTPLGRWALSKARQIAGTEREAQAASRDQLQRTMAGRSTQLGEVAARQAARDTEEQTRQKAFSAAQAEHAKTAAAAAEVEQRNLARQQEVDRLNKRNELDHAGAQAQHQIDKVRQEDMPRQATQGLLNDARSLIGLRPLEMNLTRESAPQTLREVGGELDRIYKGMSFDPNRGGWMGTAQRVQQDISNRLRQDPNAQALWDRVFQGKAFMPGLRTEAGAVAPAMGVAPATVRGPGQTFQVRSAPTGEVQGPMGTRSGPISGDQLSLMMSRLTRAQQEFGLQAQRGGGEIYRSIADGLSQMRRSVEQQLDASFPKLAAQRQAANQAYFLTSRVMDAIDVHGVATPEALQKAFKAAEGDTRFGTDKRFADIKDRLEAQYRQHTTPIDPPRAPTQAKGYDEPVPKVSKAPAPLEPLPDVQPVPLKVPKSTRAPTPGAKTDERVPAEAVHAAGHVAGHLGRMAGIPGVGSVVRGAMRYGPGVTKGVLRGTRDAARVAATPAATVTSGLTGAVMDDQKRRREQRERRKQEAQ